MSEPRFSDDLPRHFWFHRLDPEQKFEWLPVAISNGPKLTLRRLAQQKCCIIQDKGHEILRVPTLAVERQGALFSPGRGSHHKLGMVEQAYFLTTERRKSVPDWSRRSRAISD